MTDCRTLRIVAAGLLGLGLVAGLVAPAAAQPSAFATHSQAESPIFTDTERSILRGVLDGLSRDRAGRDGAAPGIRGRGAGGLPPGIAMNLERGKPLPPGIARQLPADVRARLPHRSQYDIVLVEDDAYLIGRATGMIVDILLGR